MSLVIAGCGAQGDPSSSPAGELSNIYVHENIAAGQSAEAAGDQAELAHQANLMAVEIVGHPECYPADLVVKMENHLDSEGGP